MILQHRPTQCLAEGSERDEEKKDNDTEENSEEETERQRIGKRKRIS